MCFVNLHKFFLNDTNHMKNFAKARWRLCLLTMNLRGVKVEGLCFNTGGFGYIMLTQDMIHDL